MTSRAASVDDRYGTRRQDDHHGRHGLRAHHRRRDARDVPVRHARPGAVRVHVGRHLQRCAGRGRAGRHPAHRPVASPPSTTSRRSRCRSSSGSTASMARPCYPIDEVREALGIGRPRRSSTATRARPRRRRPPAHAARAARRAGSREGAFTRRLSPGRTTSSSSAGSQRAPLSTPSPRPQPSATAMRPPPTRNTWPVTPATARWPSQVTSGAMFSGPLGSHSAFRRSGPAAAEVLGHAGARAGRDRVDRHVVPRELLAAMMRERGDARLRRAVVGLAGVGEQTRRRRRADHATARPARPPCALAPVRGRPPRRARTCP